MRVAIGAAVLAPDFVGDATVVKLPTRCEGMNAAAVDRPRSPVRASAFMTMM